MVYCIYLVSRGNMSLNCFVNVQSYNQIHKMTSYITFIFHYSRSLKCKWFLLKFTAVQSDVNENAFVTTDDNCDIQDHLFAPNNQTGPYQGPMAGVPGVWKRGVSTSASAMLRQRSPHYTNLCSHPPVFVRLLGEVGMRWGWGRDEVGMREGKWEGRRDVGAWWCLTGSVKHADL